MELSELMKASASRSTASIQQSHLERRASQLRRTRAVSVTAAFLVLAAAGVAGANSLIPDSPTLLPAEEESVPSHQTYSDEDGGFAVTYPSDWYRAEESLTPELVDPFELFSVASFPLEFRESTCNHMPGGALETMRSTDVFVSVQERTEGPDGRLKDHPQRPLDFSVGNETSMLACIPESLEGSWIPFSDGERLFYALVVFGPDASSEDREEVWGVLNGVRFGPEDQRLALSAHRLALRTERR